MTTFLLCMITLISPFGKQFEEESKELRGRFLSEDQDAHYFVDFSEDAKARGYWGDYSNYKVGKNMCRDVK